MKILLAHQSYLQRSKSSTGMRLVNAYSEPNPEGSKYPYTIYGTPGYVEFVDMGSKSSIQGMQKMGSLLYVVTNNEVFTVTEAGVKTSLGSITITSTTEDRVMMTNNGTQLTILTDDGTAWVATSSSLAQITDGDYPLSDSVTTIDGYTVASKKDSGQFNISSLLDTTAWDALDFATSEERPDNIVRSFAFNGALWHLNENTYEVYYNSGNADFPFDQIQGAVNTTRGCGAKFSVVEADNRMIFLGNDRVVYSVVGYNVQRISHHGIESAFNDYTTVSDAFAFVTEIDGHKFYNITFPTEKETWSCDLSNLQWSERTSLVNNLPTRWSANAYESFAGKQLVGHDTNGKVYELSMTTYTEDGNAIERIVDGAVQWKDGQRITYDKVRLDIDAGVGLSTGQGSDPQIMMSYSDDGHITFSNEKWRGIGKIGEYSNRSVWRRLGAARERIFRFKLTDPVPFRVTGAYAEGRIGRS